MAVVSVQITARFCSLSVILGLFRSEIQMEMGGKRQPKAATVSKRTKGELARKTTVSPTDFHYKLRFEPINI